MGGKEVVVVESKSFEDLERGCLCPDWIDEGVWDRREIEGAYSMPRATEGSRKGVGREGKVELAGSRSDLLLLLRPVLTPVRLNQILTGSLQISSKRSSACLWIALAASALILSTRRNATDHSLPSLSLSPLFEQAHHDKSSRAE